MIAVGEELIQRDQVTMREVREGTEFPLEPVERVPSGTRRTFSATTVRRSRSSAS